MNFRVSKDGKVFAPCTGCGQEVELKEFPAGEATCQNDNCKSTFPYSVPPGIGPEKLQSNSAKLKNNTAKKKPRPAWTKEDDQILIDAFSRGGISEAEQLFQGRFTRCTIYNHARRLHIQMNRKTGKWSEADKRTLREIYPVSGSRGVRKALDFRFSRQAINYKAYALSVEYQSRALWTKDDEKILHETYPDSGCRGTFKALNKKFTKGAIIKCASRLGIKTNHRKEIARSKNEKTDFSIRVKPGQKVILHIEIIPEIA